MLATLPQLEDHLGQSFDAPTEIRALQALENASSIVQTYTGQDFTEATTSETFIYGVDRVLRLSQRPVTAVTSVTVDGIPWSADLWDFTSDGWIYEPGGIIGRWFGSWRGASVTVTYTHGYTTVPADVVGTVLGLSARILDNPTALGRESIGTSSQDYAPQELTPLEKLTLDTYRGVVVA